MADLALVYHLRRQLGFITRSCEMFDAGHLDEAIRVATAIRVLLHDTRKSVSLLTQLSVRDSLTLISTAVPEPPPELPPGLTKTFGMHIGAIRIGPEGSAHEPQCDQPGRPLPALTWWGEALWVLDASTSVTRKDLVLAAVNKDGGAHVDDPTPAYIRLMEGPFDALVRFSLAEGSPTRTALTSLRQLGFELLRSTTLTALATG